MPFQDTIMNEDGYPSYRRRSPEDGGNFYHLKKGTDVWTITNQWVVPYCPLLSRAFKAHINVEYCASINAIKYVTKVIDIRSRTEIQMQIANTATPHLWISVHNKRLWYGHIQCQWRWQVWRGGQVRDRTIHIIQWGSLAPMWVWDSWSWADRSTLEVFWYTKKP